MAEAVGGLRLCLSCSLRVFLTGILSAESPCASSFADSGFPAELAVQISEETPADVLARNMRRHSSAGNAPGRAWLQRGALNLPSPVSSPSAKAELTLLLSSPQFSWALGAMELGHSLGWWVLLKRVEIQEWHVSCPCTAPALGAFSLSVP